MRALPFPMLLVALAILVIAGAQSIPPPIYDPLGSAALPIAAAALVGILALAVAGRELAARRTAQATPVPSTPDRNKTAAAFGIVTVAYVAAMAFEVLSFRWATACFVLACVLLLAGARRSALVPALGLAILTGFGGHLLFTQFFYVALP